MQHRSSIIFRTALAAGVALACTGAAAQTAAKSAGAYPARTVKILVAYTAGTSADAIARRAAEKLSSRLGQNFIVENKPGASGTIGTSAAAEAAADGYTLMIAPTTHVVTPAFRKTSYDPVTSFAPIGQIAESAQVVVTSPGTPANDLKELVSYIKQRGDDASYSSPGIATTAHLYTMVLQNSIGTKMRHIPASGLGTAIMDVVQGSVTMIIAPVEAARPLIASGKLKAIAQTGKSRSPLLPNVPTVAESGYPDYTLAVWVGLYAPAGTPPAIVSLLNKEINTIFGAPEMKARLAENGFSTVLGTPEDLDKLTRTEFARWKEVITTSGISPE